jgi:hypothetical protein
MFLLSYLIKRVTALFVFFYCIFNGWFFSKLRGIFKIQLKKKDIKQKTIFSNSFVFLIIIK